MYKKVLHVFALFALLLNLKVRGYDLSYFRNHCRSYVGDEKIELSSYEQCRAKVRELLKKMISYVEPVAMTKERSDVETLPVCGEDPMGKVSYSSINDTAPTSTDEHEYSFWSPTKNDKEPWIQIELSAPTEILQIGTGRYSDDGCLKAFTISYGNSTDNLQQIKGNGEEKFIFDGSVSKNEYKQDLPFSVICQYIRLYPEIWCRDKITYFKVYPAKCQSPN